MSKLLSLRRMLIYIDGRGVCSHVTDTARSVSNWHVGPDPDDGDIDMLKTSTKRYATYEELD